VNPVAPPGPIHPSKALSDEALRWIVRLHSGEASAADRTGFRNWREQSPEHEAAAAEAEALWSDASNLHRDPVTGLIRPGRRRPIVSRRTVVTGIAGLGAVGAGIWASGIMRSLSADHVTGVAETRVVELPDGSRATLNALSAIDVDYTAQRRRAVLIGGQVFFEVRSDRFRPFDVQLRGNVVTAVGTAFDINCNLPGGDIAIAVSENAVRISAATSLPTADAVVVSEHEGVTIAANGRVGSVARQDVTAASAWRTGVYIAEGKTLDEVIAAFRTYHRGWIVIRDDSLKSLKINAVLDLRTPDASLDALAGGLPIRVQHLSQFLTVIFRA
jgi:transmembrane sensor